MNKTIIGVLSFAGGAVVGAVAAYFITKDKCEKQMQAQLSTVRTEFDNYLQKSEEEKEKVVREKIAKEEKEKEKDELRNVAKRCNYGSPVPKPEPKKKEYKKHDGPYLIEQGGEEFGGFMAVSLEYYTDGVLLDGVDVIEDKDKDDIVGIANLALLAEDNPLIWVRNERLQVDYEIAYIDEDFYPDEE